MLACPLCAVEPHDGSRIRDRRTTSKPLRRRAPQQRHPRTALPSRRRGDRAPGTPLRRRNRLSGQDKSEGVPLDGGTALKVAASVRSVQKACPVSHYGLRFALILVRTQKNDPKQHCHHHVSWRADQSRPFRSFESKRGTAQNDTASVVVQHNFSQFPNTDRSPALNASAPCHRCTLFEPSSMPTF